MNKKQAVMVTTKHRGVFFGYADKIPSGKTITLERARMAVYWSQDMGGILGLASKGPSASCKIGPSVREILLQDVTSCTKVSDAAAAKWEASTWMQ